MFDGYRELSAKGERYLLMRGCGAGNVLPMMPGCLMLLLKSLRLTGLLPTTTVYIYRRKHIKYSFIVHCYICIHYKYPSGIVPMLSIIGTITIMPNLTPSPRRTCLQLWAVASGAVFLAPAAQLIFQICQMELGADVGAEIAAGGSRFGYLQRPMTAP